VWVGTRFVASRESEAHADYKKRLLAASQADAVYTEIFHVGWPPNSAHRVLRNPLTEGSSPPPGPVGSVRFGDRTMEVPLFGTATPTIHTEGAIELMANYAGQGVGLVRNILPAAEIVQQMISEAEESIRRLSSKLT
jgi:NAD(P)H-dependent flavin oxidoreductase YrpB (nitropropane dioxygenase family)